MVFGTYQIFIVGSLSDNLGADTFPMAQQYNQVSGPSSDYLTEF